MRLLLLVRFGEWRLRKWLLPMYFFEGASIICEWTFMMFQGIRFITSIGQETFENQKKNKNLQINWSLGSKNAWMVGRTWNVRIRFENNLSLTATTFSSVGNNFVDVLLVFRCLKPCSGHDLHSTDQPTNFSLNFTTKHGSAWQRRFC